MQNGMLEETFSFGRSPRTFRYENGGRQIAVREGGQYGAVGKIFTFDQNGILETAWGREGEIERVFIFESGNDAITERTGGWYGPVRRTIVFEGIEASVFREPEGFLQFAVFSEQDEEEGNAVLSGCCTRKRSWNRSITRPEPVHIHRQKKHTSGYHPGNRRKRKRGRYPDRFHSGWRCPRG